MPISTHVTFPSTNGSRNEYARSVEDGAGDLVAVMLVERDDDVTAPLRRSRTLADVLAVAPEATAFPRVKLSGVLVIVDDEADEVRVVSDGWSYPGVPAGILTMAVVLCYRPSASSPNSAIVPLGAWVYEELTTGSTLSIVLNDLGLWSSRNT